MPAAEGERRAERTPSTLRLVFALGFGSIGVVSALAARNGPSLGWLTAGAWLAAMLSFGSARSRRRLVPPAAVAAAGGGVALAAVLTALAARTWVLAPVALAAWVAVAHVLEVRWSAVLTTAAGSLAAAAAAMALGAPGTSDGLALLSYALASLACGTAVASRLRS